MAKGILGCPRMQGNSQEIVSASYAGQTLTNLNGGVAVSLIDNSEVGNPIIGPFDGADFFGFLTANDINTYSQTVSVVRKGLDVPVQFVDGADLSAGIGLNADGVVCALADADYILNASVNEENINVVGYGAKESQAVSIDIFGGGAVPSP